MFDFLQEPMRDLPYMIGELVELLVSMKRIQDFMLCDTINPTLINYLDVRFVFLIISIG